jgi:hypothetical protein
MVEVTFVTFVLRSSPVAIGVVSTVDLAIAVNSVIISTTGLAVHLIVEGYKTDFTTVPRADYIAICVSRPTGVTLLSSYFILVFNLKFIAVALFAEDTLGQESTCKAVLVKSKRLSFGVCGRTDSISASGCLGLNSITSNAGLLGVASSTVCRTSQGVLAG